MITGFGTVMTTTASRGEAQGLARLLVEEHLAACVQMIPIASTYRWKDEICEEEETLLLAKTRAALFDRVIARIREVHKYELPQVVAVPFAAGLPAYLDWIAANTKNAEQA